LETILRRERFIAAACLGGLVIAAWAYLVYMKVTMPDMKMAGMVMTDMQKWGAMDVVLLFVMWSVMMVAMMTPSAAPMMLAFLTVNHGRQKTNRPLLPLGFFLGGYLVVWTAYSAVATLAQWGLHEAALLSTTMSATSTALNAGLLIAAGDWV
jgi:predicted metal-binding membrane protein